MISISFLTLKEKQGLKILKMYNYIISILPNYIKQNALLEREKKRKWLYLKSFL